MFRIDRQEADTIRIFLTVTCGAIEDGVGPVERQADSSLRLAVRVRAAADNGAADKAVLKLLAHAFGIARSGLDIIGDEESTDKTLIAPDSDTLRAQLEALL